MLDNQKSNSRSGNTEAIVIIKAAPQVGQKHGETVCCAGIDLHGKWLRIYPVSFRLLEDGKKFGRWDRIRFSWRKPNDDPRIESVRVDQQSLSIVGTLKVSERERFLANLVVTSLNEERRQGRSLALLKPEIEQFKIEKRPEIDVQADAAKFEALRKQNDLFNAAPLIPYTPCPYRFKYKYRTADGQREGTCQDWELEATYYRWAKEYGEQKALSEIERIWGKEFPQKGMLLAMGTHSLYPDQWLINGVVRMDEVRQLSLL